MAELEGKTLDHYKLSRLIGKGGMANVYEALDLNPRLQRVVAVKVFKREDEEMLRRFIREAQLLAHLHHPHLIEIFDSGDCPLDGMTRYYIVMPLMTGGTLRLRIRRSPLSLPDVCQCLSDIGSALDYIHSEGIVHRDIKASNVLLNEEGRCYLADFGIARITSDATQLTSTGDVLGTVDYVAPELFEVHRRADALSDLYSLGVLLYEMATGRLPFSADNQLALISMHVSKQPPSPRQFVPEIPTGVEKVINKALSKKPEDRYPSAKALTQAFYSAVTRSGIVVPGFSASGTNLDRNSRTELTSTLPRMATPLPEIHASPLAAATEGFVAAPPAYRQAPVVLPGHEETPQPLSTTRPTERPGQLPGQPGRQPARPDRRVIIVAGILAAILILAVPTTIALRLRPATQTTSTPGALGTTSRSGQTSVSGQGSPSPASTQTAIANAALTATTSAHATATAIVVAPTATAQAAATATVGPIATATSGQLIYQDSLTDPNSANVSQANWDNNNQCFFDAQGYHVTQTPSPIQQYNFQACREQNNQYANLALTVDVDLLSGHSAGVYIRMSLTGFNNPTGYLFEIDGQNQYKISRQKGSGNTPLQDWTDSPALHSGNNLLEILAQGSSLSLYANHSFLFNIQDSYYQQADTVGFTTSADNSNGGTNAEAVFSNLKIYQLAA